MHIQASKSEEQCKKLAEAASDVREWHASDMVAASVAAFTVSGYLERMRGRNEDA